MKLCNKCNQEFELSEFASRSAMCKPCHREYTREHYRNNKQAYGDKARRSALKYDKKYREIVLNHLLTHPCVDCGEDDPVVLEFDHIDPSTKNFTISEATKNQIAIDKLILEISKCEIRCANCHRRRTAHQFNWWIVDAFVYPRATNALKG
jgi:Zn finger protein HypA/HybF involved in hydrogenase expression